VTPTVVVPGPRVEGLDPYMLPPGPGVEGPDPRATHTGPFFTIPIFIATSVQGNGLTTTNTPAPGLSVPGQGVQGNGSTSTNTSHVTNVSLPGPGVQGSGPTSTGIPGPGVEGNGPTVPGPNPGLPVALIVGVICGIVGFFIAIGCITTYYRRRRRIRGQGEMNTHSNVRDGDQTDGDRAKAQ
jgi:hypothetical protein